MAREFDRRCEELKDLIDASIFTLEDETLSASTKARLQESIDDAAKEREAIIAAGHTAPDWSDRFHGVLHRLYKRLFDQNDRER